LLLAELSQHAAIVGGIGNSYAEKYLQKAAYRETLETGIQWVLSCMSTPRYFYKMFRMSSEVFNELHDLLVSNYGLTSNKNVSSIESLAMFLWIVGGPQSFLQAENRFTRSLWTIHTKFHEVLRCLRKLAKDNITPRYPTFSTEHEKVRENRFWPYFKEAIGAIDGSHVKVIVPLDETVNHTNRHGYTSQSVLAICDFDMRFTFAVTGWPGSAHDLRILNHALANFSSFPVAPKDNNGFLYYVIMLAGCIIMYLTNLFYLEKYLLIHKCSKPTVEHNFYRQFQLKNVRGKKLAYPTKKSPVNINFYTQFF